jgi:uncharacterized coiled-coil DUF342 family protein
MNEEKNENVRNVVARETTCGEGIRRMREEIIELDKKEDEICAEMNELDKKISEIKERKNEEENVVIQKNYDGICKELRGIFNAKLNELTSVRERQREVRNMLNALEMHDELLALANRKGEKRHAFVLKFKHDSIFYYKKCVVCGSDATKCDCRDEDGNLAGWEYTDIIAEVGDEDITSHLPPHYFKK